MRLFAIVVLVLALGAGGAFAQAGGEIGVFSDAAGVGCNLTETLYVTNNVYIVHVYAAEGNTAQFRLEHNWGALPGAISFGANLTLGDLFTGITITYVGCKALPHVLATVGFIPVTPTPPCTVFFHIRPDPAVASGEVEVVDCSSQILIATGGFLGVNLNDGCPCAIATEETNWSRIKALYQ